MIREENCPRRTEQCFVFLAMGSRGGFRGRGRGRGSRLRPPSPVSRALQNLSNEDGKGALMLDEAGRFPILKEGFTARASPLSSRERDMLMSNFRLISRYKKLYGVFRQNNAETRPYRYRDRKRDLKDRRERGNDYKDWSLREDQIFLSVPEKDATEFNEPERLKIEAEKSPREVANEDPLQFDSQEVIERNVPDDGVDRRLDTVEVDEDDDYGREEHFDDDDDDYHHQSGDDEALL
mmetsp:Transcript_4165/g.5912  ORF Transcript_4165/g.5912 Transcript_4165/m.5912 type:complete len:237 (-) Transcript_4165:479-1189(-)